MSVWLTHGHLSRRPLISRLGGRFSLLPLDREPGPLGGIVSRANTVHAQRQNVTDGRADNRREVQRLEKRSRTLKGEARLPRVLRMRLTMRGRDPG